MSLTLQIGNGGNGGGSPTPPAKPAAGDPETKSGAGGSDVLSLNVDPNAPKGGDAPAPKARPDNVPEKFWNAETGEVRVDELLKSQLELERKLSSGNKPNDQQPPPKTPAGEGTQTTAVEAARAEFAKDGKLSDATYGTLAKSGLDRATVDNYIALQKQSGEQDTAAVLASFGGERDAFDKASAWAFENLEPGEIAALNAAFDSGNRAAMANAGKRLADLFKANGDHEPTLQGGDGGNSPTTEKYTSRADMMRDQGSPQYRNDPQFRRKVEQRIAASDEAIIFG